MSIIKQVLLASRRSALIAFAVLVGSFAIAAPAQAQTFEVKPYSLTVHDIEDGWPDNTDEVSMTYGGQSWYDKILNGGTSFKPFHAATAYHGYMRFDMYEHDGSYPKFLGTRYAYSDTTSLVWGGPGSAFHYVLSLKEPVKSDPGDEPSDCGIPGYTLPPGHQCP